MLGIVCTLIAFASLTTKVGDDAIPDDPFAAMERHIETMIAQAEPSVVSIVVSHKTYGDTPNSQEPGELGGYKPPKQPRNPFQTVAPSETLDLSNPVNVADHMTGSGIVLDESGLILTNYHLIDRRD